MLLSWSGSSRLRCLFFGYATVLCISTTIALHAMSENNLYNGVIVHSTSSNNRFYLTESTAMHFTKLKSLVRTPNSVPECIIDTPCTLETLQTLCTQINPKSINPEDKEKKNHVLITKEMLMLAHALEASNDTLATITDSQCYLIHPELDRPIVVPNAIAQHYQAAFNTSVMVEEDALRNPLRYYTMLFNMYGSEEVSKIYANIALEDVDPIRNLHEILIQDNTLALPQCLTNALIAPLAQAITDKKLSTIIRQQAIQHYTSLFAQSNDYVRKQLAQNADSNDPAYNLCDALCELMYDAAISPTWKAVTQIAPLYNDKSRWNDEEDKKLESAQQERCKTILDDIEKALTTWHTQDQAAKLFWAIKKESNQPEFTSPYIQHTYTTMNSYTYGFRAISSKDDILQLFTPNNAILQEVDRWNKDGGCKARHVNFKEELSEWLLKTEIRTYTIYCENVRRTHIPFFAAIFGPLSCGDGLHYEFRGDKPLRLLSHSDLMALNTPRTTQSIELNIGSTTKMAPLSTCKRPLNINGVLALPSELTSDTIYTNPDSYRSSWSGCILPPSWRLHTLLELGALVGAAALSYRYILKPIETAWIVRQQLSLKTQIANEVLASTPANSDDAMRYIFQRAHHNVPFMEDTIPLLGTILKNPVNRTSSYSLETIDTIEKLVNTTRSIEKLIPTTDQSILTSASGNSIGIGSVCPWILFHIGYDARLIHKDKDVVNDDLRTQIYHAPYLPPIRAFFGRLCGLVGGLFVNPAHFVEPLHVITTKS